MFPAPAYAKWAEAFKASSNTKMNYQAIGSSGGVLQIDGRTMDFGATDASLKGEELVRKERIQFPTLIGGEVPVVNLRGIAPGQPRLAGAVPGDSYPGMINRWSDPAIVALNPQIPLPDSTISPVSRSDGSGTSFSFTNYLSELNADWKTRIGEGTPVGRPTGTGGRGNIGATSVLMYAKADNAANASQALRFFHWGLTKSQSITSELGYAALPVTVVESVEAAWNQVRDASGRPLTYK